MNSIILILKKIKNTLPYFIAVILYFFFISLEVEKEKEMKGNVEMDKILKQNKKNVVYKQFKINIPVVPYKE